MANMMAIARLEGTCDSGYGVRLSGFHCASGEFAKKLKDLIPGQKIAQCESNGYCTFMSCENKYPALDGPLAMTSFRREPPQFFLDLDHFLKSLRVQHILDMTLSESHGSLGLTLLYVPAPEVSGMAGV